MLREADCNHWSLVHNNMETAKILDFFYSLITSSFWQMMKIGENFIQICRAVFKISRQMLLPWQYNFVLEKCVYFHDFQKKMLTFSLIISHNVPLLKIRAYIIKLADIYIYMPMHVQCSVSMETDMLPVSVSFDLYKNNTFSTAVYSQGQRCWKRPIIGLELLTQV